MKSNKEVFSSLSFPFGTNTILFAVLMQNLCQLNSFAVISYAVQLFSWDIQCQYILRQSTVAYISSRVNTFLDSTHIHKHLQACMHICTVLTSSLSKTGDRSSNASHTSIVSHLPINSTACFASWKQMSKPSSELIKLLFKYQKKKLD